MELWLCRCTDALQRLFVPTWPSQLLPSSLLPGCPWMDREPLGGKGVGCSVLPKHRQTSWVQVCAEKKEIANEWWGIGLWCLLVGKVCSLAQAHLWGFHLLNDFRHFVGMGGLCDGLMDTRRLLFFPSTCSLPSLWGHYFSLCFGGVGQSCCFISDRDEMNLPLLSHLLRSGASRPSMLGTHSMASKATSSPVVSLAASSFCKLN